ncbi:MAG: NAD(+) diphosphatase [Deltaproteobacteria bacterium]|nr:NAD(+) diphosphatase [Deltaproteobacteria bacterium]
MEEKRQFISGIVPPAGREGPSWWFVFQGDRLLIVPGASSGAIPFLADLGALGLRAERQHYLGRLDGSPCYAVEVAQGSAAPPGMVFQGLRQVYTVIDEDLFTLAGRALQIVEWDRTHQFCSRCGSPVKILPTERAKECPRCGLLQFPRLSPAIIVRVARGRELLLARSSHFVPGRYSVIAGFVEPGETLEQAVAREVREEVGLRIRDIRYFASQPWPFPHSLMIGFTAAYAGGEITPDPDEIEDARWFTPDSLPGLPSKMSISRRLIDSFLADQGVEQEQARGRAGP